MRAVKKEAHANFLTDPQRGNQQFNMQMLWYMGELD
jgi:hypothetical protein